MNWTDNEKRQHINQLILHASVHACARTYLCLLQQYLFWWLTAMENKTAVWEKILDEHDIISTQSQTSTTQKQQQICAVSSESSLSILDPWLCTTLAMHIIGYQQRWLSKHWLFIASHHWFSTVLANHSNGIPKRRLSTELAVFIIGYQQRWLSTALAATALGIHSVCYPHYWSPVALANHSVRYP